jgi:hypothetical protein
MNETNLIPTYSKFNVGFHLFSFIAIVFRRRLWMVGYASSKMYLITAF